MREISVLSVEGITVKYPNGLKAIRNVSFSASVGIVGLLGRNGAGKSTLIRTITTLQKPSAGAINFLGQDINSQPNEFRKALGYLPQEFGFYKGISARGFLNYVGSLKGLKSTTLRKQVTDVLGLVGLSDVADKKIDTFSGGMKQRVGIAQALLGAPQILVLDEPTSGLDPIERHKINELLHSISKNRLILLSTHIVEDIQNLCHKVIVLKNGEVALHGAIEDLLAQLSGKIWVVPDSVAIPPKALVLRNDFVYGKSYSRVLFDGVIDSLSPKVVTLEDLYFADLKGALNEFSS